MKKFTTFKNMIQKKIYFNARKIIKTEKLKQIIKQNVSSETQIKNEVNQ